MKTRKRRKTGALEFRVQKNKHPQWQMPRERPNNFLHPSPRIHNTNLVQRRSLSHSQMGLSESKRCTSSA